MSQATNHTTIGEGIWFDKVKYDEAEKKYYERLNQKGNLISAEEKEVDNIHLEEEKSINEMSPEEQHQLSIKESIWLDKFKYDTAEIKYYERNAKKTYNEENLIEIKSPFCGKAVEKKTDDQQINSGDTLTDSKDEISRITDDYMEGKEALGASSELDKLVTSIVEESDEEFLKLEKLKELNLIDLTSESLITNGKGIVKYVDPKQGQDVFDTQITENQPNKNICLKANREDVTKSQRSSTDKERNSQAYKMSSSKGLKPVGIDSKNVQPGEICSPKNVKSEEITFPNKVQPGEICSPKKVKPGEICSPKNLQSVEICLPKNVQSGEICSHRKIKPEEICSPKNVKSEEITFPNKIQPGKICSPKTVKPGEMCSPKNVNPVEICFPKNVQPGEICSPKNVKSEETTFPDKVQPGEICSPKNVNPTEICFPENVQPGEICSPKKVMPMEICSSKNVKTVDVCLPKKLKPKEISSSKSVRSEDNNPMSHTTKNEKQSQSSPENLPTRSNKSPKFTHEKVKTENSKVLMTKNETQKDIIRQENSKLPKGYHHSHNSTNDPSSRDKETNVNTIPELEKTRHHHQSKISAISDENNPSIKTIQPVSNQNVQVIIQNDKQTEVNSDDPQFKPKDSRKKKRTKKDRVRDRKGFTTEGTKNGGWNSLAGEVAKARQHIKTSLQCIDDIAVTSNNVSTEMTSRLNSLEKENNDLKKQVTDLSQLLKKLEVRVGSLERTVSAAQSSGGQQKGASAPAKPQQRQPPPPNDEEDDGVDLFGSDSEEEDEETAKVKEQRLAEYAARKSKKPTLIAKSNIILDVKPWDDETDMKLMEQEVRKISTDGLIWGASKLVPLAYGIHKLQISCVVEDEKVSIDWLTDTIMENEDYVQSVDIAAFNKV